MATQELDQAKAEAFAERMLADLRGAAVTLTASVGQRAGLFDTMADLVPSTSQQIADAAGAHERYVREWLGAMVVAGIIDYDPSNATYALPAEHATALTRAAGPDNIAAIAAYFPVLASVEDEIAECFRSGGGVPYSAYPRFQQVQAEDSAAVFDATLVHTTLPLVPGLIEHLEAGIEVADVGCGSGHAINLMAKAFPNSTFVGYDLSEDGIARARREARALYLSNARFEAKDAATLDAPGVFGLITAFDAIHDQARPREVLPPHDRGRAGPTGNVPDDRHGRVKQARGKPRSPSGTDPLHLLAAALHAGVAGLRWRRPPHRMGRAEGPRAAQRGGLRARRDQARRRRHLQQLLRRLSPREALTPADPRFEFTARDARRVVRQARDRLLRSVNPWTGSPWTGSGC